MIAIIFLLLFFFSLLMMLSVSKPIWQSVNRFAYIDYPWRYLFLAVFSASVLGGWVVVRLGLARLKLLKGLKTLKLTPGVLVGMVFIAVCLYTNRNYLRVNAWLDWNPQSFIGDGETSNTFDEYASRGVDNNYLQQKRELIEIRQGEGSYRNLVRTTNKITFTVNDQGPAAYRVNVLYFPDVLVSVDNQPISYQYKERGVLDFTLPAGEHQVKIEYQRTKLEKISLFISGISLLIFLYLLTGFLRHRCRGLAVLHPLAFLAKPGVFIAKYFFISSIFLSF